ncbi:hypothetical protein HZH66_002901 [Vespula vulgaris]|uniref:Uncharacterized protein n=1 Tax=Vespula vulgaris TaxID=7454 RepID=A0A834NHU2_VESVU|nr:hypothetical protein HZH66_002901 [Vespula vulgaris]
MTRGVCHGVLSACQKVLPPPFPLHSRYHPGCRHRRITNENDSDNKSNGDDDDDGNDDDDDDDVAPMVTPSIEDR